MKTVFVTGLSGFVGQHFRLQIASTPGWQLLEAATDYDIADGEQLDAAIRSLPSIPDAVLHLAAQSNVPDSFRDPAATLRTNLFGTLRLLQALRAKDFRGRFIYVGTADAYGLVPEHEMPVVEDRPLRPRNPYAVSKAAAEALVYQWTQTEDLDAVVVRPFNHIGPGQDDRFVVGSLARQVAEIVLGLREPRVEVGDIDVSRDFTDVRDIVRAYVLLLDRGDSGRIYNLGSGREYSVRSILETLLSLVGVRAEVRVNAAKLRRSEQRRVSANVDRAFTELGWKSEIEIEATLLAALEQWKETLSHE